MTALARYFLSRLERLIQRRRDWAKHMNALGLEMLDRAISTTAADCIAAGASDQAQALMEKAGLT